MYTIQAWTSASSIFLEKDLSKNISTYSVWHTRSSKIIENCRKEMLTSSRIVTCSKSCISSLWRLYREIFLIAVLKYILSRSVARNFPRGVPASGKNCRPCGSVFSPVLPSSHFFSTGCARAPFAHPLATPLILSITFITHVTIVFVAHKAGQVKIRNKYENPHYRS